MQQKTIPFIDYRLFSGRLGDFTPTDKTLINTINLNAFVVAESDFEFKQSLLKSDVLLADGIGAVLGPRFLTGDRVNKIAGANLHQYFLERYKLSGGKFFYLGASQATLDKVIARLAVEYPKIEIAVYSPPFKPKFDAEDNRQMIEAVNQFKPDVLFVGMTAPKQEKWAYQHKNDLQASFICPVGAVFDFYAGTIPRPSEFWIGLGLEWFVRLVKEPKRMWRRYLYNGPVFARIMIKEKFRKRNSNRN